MTAKSTVIKGRGGKFGGCAVKAVSLTSGGLRHVREAGQWVVSFSTPAQESAEGIVAGYPVKARTTERVIRTAGS